MLAALTMRPAAFAGRVLPPAATATQEQSRSAAAIRARTHGSRSQGEGRAPLDRAGALSL